MIAAIGAIITTLILCVYQFMVQWRSLTNIERHSMQEYIDEMEQRRQEICYTDRG